MASALKLTLIKVLYRYYGETKFWEPRRLLNKVNYFFAFEPAGMAR